MGSKRQSTGTEGRTGGIMRGTARRQQLQLNGTVKYLDYCDVFLSLLSALYMSHKQHRCFGNKKKSWNKANRHSAQSRATRVKQGGCSKERERQRERQRSATRELLLDPR